MTVGLSHFHEIRALVAPKLCACGRPATWRSGRCDSCQERAFDIAADARHEQEDAA